MNGAWLGVHRGPQLLIEKMRLYRRNGLLPLYWSFFWNQEAREILCWTDAGRLSRPLFFIHDDKVSYDTDRIKRELENKTLTWNACVIGFGEKKRKNIYR